jgi:hypothetical protein
MSTPMAAGHGGIRIGEIECEKLKWQKSAIATR